MIPYTPPGPAKHIPIIDLQDSFSGNRQRSEAIAWEIHKAGRDCGFFYVANHGIEQSLVDNAFGAAKRFFEQPLSRKLDVSVENWPSLRGYDPMQAQTLDAGSRRTTRRRFTWVGTSMRITPM